MTDNTDTDFCYGSMRATGAIAAATYAAITIVLTMRASHSHAEGLV